MGPETDMIFKALRLVPEFDGNPNVLTRFIRMCDQLAVQYLSATPGSEFNNMCVINGILNKITGTASCTINSNGIPDNWAGIRTTLINNFSDQRDETALYNDLSTATQGSKSHQEFYDHCQTLFSTIMTYVTLHETIGTTIEAKRDLYKKVTMQAYVRGLKEPLGSRIRCMRPPTIEKAHEYVQEELNVMYLQQRSEPQKQLVTPRLATTSLPPTGFTPPRPQYFHQPSPPVPNWPVPIGQRPIRPPPQAFKFPTQAQPGYRMPTNTQRMFAAPPPNYNPRSNVFRMPPRNNAPQPMSGVQHFTPKVLPQTRMLTGHDWSKFGNPPPTNYFKTRDVNMNECATYDYDDSGYSYQEPEYNYYYDNEHYSSGFAPGFACEPNYYVTTDNDQVTDDYQPQPGPSDEEQDFQKGTTSPRLK